MGNVCHGIFKLIIPDSNLTTIEDSEIPQKVLVEAFHLRRTVYPPVKDTQNESHYSSEEEGKTWNSILDKYHLAEKSRSHYISRLLQCVILETRQVNDIPKDCEILGNPTLDHCWVLFVPSCPLIDTTMIYLERSLSWLDSTKLILSWTSLVNESQLLTRYGTMYLHHNFFD